jgi:4-hydroxyproline epimerase
MNRIQIIDSHTGGEPTRVVLDGGPALGNGPLSEQRDRFSRDFDAFRSAIVNEPRGSDVLVGALLVPPHAPDCTAGVIFFNNVGVLGMCGHGTIGLIATLAYLGRIRAGDHRLDTPVGVVTATLHPDGSVSVANVPSQRKAKGVRLEVPGIGPVIGDVAWGGNWFFLVEEHPWSLDLNNVEVLTDVTWRIRQAANAQGYPEIDHVELFGPQGPGAIPEISFYALARPTIGLLVAPGPAPSWRALPLTGNWQRAIPGCRRASWAARSPVDSDGPTEPRARSSPRSPAAPTSPPRRL